jgi:hypothetical protein
MAAHMGMKISIQHILMWFGALPHLIIFILGGLVLAYLGVRHRRVFDMGVHGLNNRPNKICLYSASSADVGKVTVRMSYQNMSRLWLWLPLGSNIQVPMKSSRSTRLALRWSSQCLPEPVALRMRSKVGQLVD